MPFFIVFYRDGFPCGHDNVLAEPVEINLFVGRIGQHFSVRCAFQPVICLYVIIDFGVGCIPHVFAVADLFGKGFENVPVVVVIVFKAVPPEVEQLRIVPPEVPALGILQKCVGQLCQSRGAVVAGRLQPQPVVRNVEAAARDGRAGVSDPAAPDNVHGVVVKAAVGICHALDDAAEKPLQIAPVVDDLRNSHFLRDVRERPMPESVHRNLMIAAFVQLDGFFFGQPTSACQLGKQSRTDIEGAFDAAAVQNVDQLFVKDHAVVIAEGQRFEPEAGET